MDYIMRSVGFSFANLSMAVYRLAEKQNDKIRFKALIWFGWLLYKLSTMALLSRWCKLPIIVKTMISETYLDAENYFKKVMHE